MIKGLWLLCLNQLFVVSQTTWSLVDNGGPSARSVHAATSDTLGSDALIWVHGGSGDALIKDLWTYNVPTRSWTLISQSSVSPSERKDHVIAWDPIEGALWIHGGSDGSQYLMDLWKRDSGNSSWTLLANSSVDGPCARSDHVAVWDSASSALWIHGGYDGVTLRQDIWKFDSQGSNWERIVDIDPPSARAYHVAVWDERKSALWIHGGYDGSFCRDVWTFDSSGQKWKLVSMDGPSARAYHAAAWDPMNLALWIHGGFDGVARRDLWRFSTLSHTWDLMANEGPSPRYNHVAAWDVTSSSFWVHGGYDGSTLRDLWQYEFTTTSTTVTTSSTVTFTVVTFSSTLTTTYTATSTTSQSKTRTSTTTTSISATSSTSVSKTATSSGLSNSNTILSRTTTSFTMSSPTSSTMTMSSFTISPLNQTTSSFTSSRSHTYSTTTRSRLSSTTTSTTQLSEEFVAAEFPFGPVFGFVFIGALLLSSCFILKYCNFKPKTIVTQLPPTPTDVPCAPRAPPPNLPAVPPQYLPEPPPYPFGSIGVPPTACTSPSRNAPQVYMDGDQLPVGSVGSMGSGVGFQIECANRWRRMGK